MGASEVPKLSPFQLRLSFGTIRGLTQHTDAFIVEGSAAPAPMLQCPSIRSDRPPVSSSAMTCPRVCLTVELSPV